MSTYDEIAEWYEHWVGTHSMREDPFFPAVEGDRICDLACGQGRLARHLADLGRASSALISQRSCSASPEAK